jgi:hypothetical protein
LETLVIPLFVLQNNTMRRLDLVAVLEAVGAEVVAEAAGAVQQEALVAAEPGRLTRTNW